MANLSIPNNWDDVYVDQYIELLSIPSDRFTIDRNIDILTILTDTEYDDDIWGDMDVDELNILMKRLSWVSTSPINNFKKEISNYKCIDINKDLSFGQYIDIDYYYSNLGYSSLPYLCSILYRKWKLDDFGNIIYEPYNYILEDRLSSFTDLKINEVYGILPLVGDYKKMIFDTYTTLFEPQFDDEEDEDDITDPEDLQIKKEEETHKKWGWESVLFKLSNNDITKYDDILNLPLIFVLNQLSYLKETNR